MKSNDFIQMVSQDIKKCDDVLLSGQGINPLLNELVGKYSKVSNNFPTIEMNPLLFRMHPNVPKENVQIIQGISYHFKSKIKKRISVYHAHGTPKQKTLY